jgi:hypothetical protein
MTFCLEPNTYEHLWCYGFNSCSNPVFKHFNTICMFSSSINYTFYASREKSQEAVKPTRGTLPILASLLKLVTGCQMGRDGPIPWHPMSPGVLYLSFLLMGTLLIG